MVLLSRGRDPFAQLPARWRAATGRQPRDAEARPVPCHASGTRPVWGDGAQQRPELPPRPAAAQSNTQRFWGVVRSDIAATSGEHELSLRAELDGGGTALAPLGRFAVVALPGSVAVSWPPGAAGPRVAIAMATYNPPQQLLTRQLASIRAQTHTNWICVISDDCSSPERYAAIEARTWRARFLLSRTPRRLGFYRNFGRALALKLSRADYVAIGRSGRRLASRTEARDASAGPSSGARSSSKRRSRWSGRTGEGCAGGHVVEHRTNNHTACCRCWSPTRSRARRR